MNEFEWKDISKGDISSVSVELGLCLANPDEPHFNPKYLGANGLLFALYKNGRPEALTNYDYKLNSLIVIRRKFGVGPSMKLASSVMDLLRSKSIGIHDSAGDFRKMGIFKRNGTIFSCTEITEGTTYTGSLNLNNVVFDRSLPENLSIEGDLHLCNSSLSSLPEGLKVGGNLYLLFNRKQIVIPSSVSIRGNVFLEDPLCNFF